MEFSEANIFVLCRVNEVIPKAPGRTSNYREVKSFLIDPNDADGFRAVVKYVFLDNPSGLFAITIDASNEESLLLPSTGWDDIFCSILAHPSYVRINEQPVVSVKGKGNAGAFGQRLIDHMEGQAMRQGYSDLLFAFVPSVIEEFDATNGFVYIEEGMFTKQDTFYNLFISRITLGELPLSFFVENDEETIGRLAGEISGAESRMVQENPQLVRILNSYHRTALSLAKSNREKTLLEEALRSKTDYLDFLLQKSKELSDSGLEFSDIIKMKKFYHAEYEVLPLWYKQFGHLIKVIMGKRTFRSLYDNKAPKYKQ